MPNASILSAFITQYGAALLAMAFVWSLTLCFFFNIGWRIKNSRLNKAFALGLSATFVGVVLYLPFIWLALAAGLGWL